VRIAVVGATGMVGEVMLKVLEERQIPISMLLPVASENSIGKSVKFNGNNIQVIGMAQAISLKPDVALFSCGGSASKEWAPKFAEVGCRVIDNSSAWRMDEDKKLVVPEVNGNQLESSDFIIANPNCSTIQLVMVLEPLTKLSAIKRVVLSTYQSVTGTGKQAYDQLMNERAGKPSNNGAYPHPIDLNCIPHCDVFQENDYTREEVKLVRESRKILSNPGLKLTATCVRVPVHGGHSESVNIEFERTVEVDQIRTTLSKTEGITVLDNPSQNEYPMPLNAEGSDEVFVGRIRKDESQDNTINLWIVSDNLRKGAATNTVQILEKLIEKGFVGNA
jgi:aspartate-semialdehyde dehydrogenase